MRPLRRQRAEWPLGNAETEMNDVVEPGRLETVRPPENGMIRQKLRGHHFAGSGGAVDRDVPAKDSGHPSVPLAIGMDAIKAKLRVHCAVVAGKCCMIVNKFDLFGIRVVFKPVGQCHDLRRRLQARFPCEMTGRRD